MAESSDSLHFSPRGEAKCWEGRQDEARAAWRAQVERLYRLLHPSAHEIRPFRFTGRQTFLLERTRLPPLVFTNHETRNTKYGLFIACCDRQLVRNAGQFLRFAHASGRPAASAAARLNRALRQNRVRDDSVPARTRLDQRSPLSMMRMLRARPERQVHAMPNYPRIHRPGFQKRDSCTWNSFGSFEKYRYTIVFQAFTRPPR